MKPLVAAKVDKPATLPQRSAAASRNELHTGIAASGMTHISTPWIAERNRDHDWVISQPGNDGQVICCLRGCDGPEWKATAAFIVRAVNAHDALVEVCEKASAWIAAGMPSDTKNVHADLDAALALAREGAA